MPKNQKPVKKFSDYFANEEFYPEVEKIEIETLLDSPIILIETRILKDFNGKFGKHDAALLAFCDAIGEDEEQPEKFEVKGTTICSGVVLVDQVRKITARQLPMETTIIMKTGGGSGNDYYMLS